MARAPILASDPTLQTHALPFLPHATGDELAQEPRGLPVHCCAEAQGEAKGLPNIDGVDGAE